MSQKTDRRMSQLLQEIRIVLPGTQALLGFQFIAFFNASFKELSSNLQLFHLVNLLLVTCSTILLISPVAFQEIIENGKSSKRFRRYTSRVIPVAMLFLIVGMAGDVFVASNLINTSSALIPVIASATVLVIGLVMWFGFTSYLNRRDA